MRQRTTKKLIASLLSVSSLGTGIAVFAVPAVASPTELEIGKSYSDAQRVAKQVNADKKGYWIKTKYRGEINADKYSGYTYAYRSATNCGGKKEHPSGKQKYTEKIKENNASAQRIINEVRNSNNSMCQYKKDYNQHEEYITRAYWYDSYVEWGGTTHIEYHYVTKNIPLKWNQLN